MYHLRASQLLVGKACLLGHLCTYVDEIGKRGAEVSLLEESILLPFHVHFVCNVSWARIDWSSEFAHLLVPLGDITSSTSAFAQGKPFPPAPRGFSVEPCSVVVCEVPHRTTAPLPLSPPAPMLLSGLFTAGTHRRFGLEPTVIVFVVVVRCGSYSQLLVVDVSARFFIVPPRRVAMSQTSVCTYVGEGNQQPRRSRRSLSPPHRTRRSELIVQLLCRELCFSPKWRGA